MYAIRSYYGLEVAPYTLSEGRQRENPLAGDSENRRERQHPRTDHVEHTGVSMERRSLERVNAVVLVDELHQRSYNFV